MDNYLAPERLEGENQYQCDGCNKKQDAVKSTRILSAPAHLLLTLLRFKYDRKTNRRAKVFTNIHYPRELQLPMSGTDGGIGRFFTKKKNGPHCVVGFGSLLIFFPS